jgi:CO/xanthine dehydrogenase Mo-binding subunit
MVSSVIGISAPRVEGASKVTGSATYSADVKLPGMLWAKVLRSPHPHARIVSVDTTAAKQVPGVVDVLTGADVEGLYQGKVLRDIPVLCWDRVRYAGDRVAAVAAETLEACNEALSLIEVEYEELPAVFDPLEAMQPDAPLVHNSPRDYQGRPGGPATTFADDLRNGCTRMAWGKGDIDAGFAEADVVLEHRFFVPSRHQAYLEPYTSVVDVRSDGRVEVWCSSKSPFRARQQLAMAVGLKDEDVRVNVTNVGGDFGGKGDARDLPIAYFFAKRTGRPVRIVMTYAEELSASNPSHPTYVDVKSGVKRDGTLTARWVRVVHASGAYAGMKPNGALSTWHYVGGCYRLPHSSFEFLQVYTNTTPGGYFRAPGAHQYTFAIECHTDMLATAVGMDPVAFRLHNMLTEGEEDAVGTRLRTMKAREVLQAALVAAGDRPARPGFGRGVGVFGRQIGGGEGGAVVTAETDGTFTMISPTPDIGTGTHTIMGQIVAREMEVPLDDVTVVPGDTDVAPFDEGPRASRVTYTEGRAVMKACAQLKAAIADGVSLPFTVRIQEDMPRPDDIMYFCAQVADVQVDSETGQVRVERVVTAHDVGAIINPGLHQGQIDGGFVTGYGLAMTEELIQQDGRIVNPHLGDYKLPCIRDLPVLQTVLVESGGGAGPYDAKAIGELANNATCAAIANAVADALGVRLYDLPVTAQKVYEGLRQLATGN